MTERENITSSSPISFTGDVAPFAKAFVAAQKATEAVKKAATNSHFKSRYADLAEVVEAVVPALNENGIGVMQSPSFDGDLVGITTVLIHESGAMAQATLHLKPNKSDPQQVGSAITYARRYALLAMTGAAPEDDDGNAASQPQGQRHHQAQRREEPKQQTAQERVEAVMQAAKNAKASQEVNAIYERSTGLRNELTKEERVKLEAFLVERTAELDANNPFDKKD